MSQRNVKDLIVGEKVDVFLLVRSKRNLTTRAGKPYLDLDLADRTGQINAKVWDNADQLSELFSRGDVIKVRGTVEEYQSQRQLKVARLRPVNESDDVDMSELVRTTAFDRDEMLTFFQDLIATMEDDQLRMLMEAFFSDDEFLKEFSNAAAARNIHHSYVGGLMEHTMKITKVSLFCADELYPDQVNRDLVIAGAILHDIGKIKELSVGPDAGYTTEGYLVGHVVLGSMMLKEKAALIENFPDEMLMQLDHILLSHHGERDWGSPIVPMTPEAMIVHSADNLDAKTEIVLSAIADDPNQDEEFTQYHRTLARHFYKGPVKREDENA